jgi:ABC-2 type transport system ATP-binding protein
MKIRIENLGKKFGNDWIFRHLTLEFSENKIYTVIGANGSGKSTLLQVLAGLQLPTEGEIFYTSENKNIPPEQIFRQIVLASPALELIEELTPTELLQFHLQFKKLANALTVTDFLERTRLASARNKPVKYFSSGMKQRLKLGLALFTEAPILLLDEPTANLDAATAAWYREEIQAVTQNRLLLIASNQPSEYDFLPHEQILM